MMAKLAKHVPAFGGLIAALISGCVPSAVPGTVDDPAPETGRLGTIVTSADFDRSPGEPIERVLQAHIPGIQLTQDANGGVAVRIRGINTYMGGTQPLYVIDGVPIQAGPNGGLVGINPHDIASIEVLKDPVSMSFYGVRGSNGIIVIKTKRAH